MSVTSLVGRVFGGWVAWWADGHTVDLRQADETLDHTKAQESGAKLIIAAVNARSVGRECPYAVGALQLVVE